MSDTSTGRSPEPDSLLEQYPLLDALIERRSRRFGPGMRLDGGPLSYASGRDDGAWLLKRPQDYPRAEIAGLVQAARERRLVELYEDPRQGRFATVGALETWLYEFQAIEQGAPGSSRPRSAPQLPRTTFTCRRRWAWNGPARCS